MNELISAFSAWRIVPAGSREIIDAIVAPEHRGPSPELRAALGRWRGKYYWPDPAHGHLILIRQTGTPRTERWLLHLVLMALTVLCTLGAGAALGGTWAPASGFGPYDVLHPAVQFFITSWHGGWRNLIPGWSFAAPLLGILLIHELGHYFAARRYAIDVSPPGSCPSRRRCRLSAAWGRSSDCAPRCSTGASCSTWGPRGRWPASSSRCW